MHCFITVHGLTCSKRGFYPLAEVLEEGGHKVRHFELAGFGERKAEKPKLGRNPLDQAAQELENIMNEYDRVTLIGHSMGSVPVLKQSLTRDKVAGVVIIEGNLIREDCGYLSRQITEEVKAHDVDAYMRKFANDMATSRYPGWRLWAQDARGVDPDVIRTYATQLVEESSNGSLISAYNKTNCNKIYIYSDEYVGHPVLSEITSGTIRYIGDAGHFVMTDQPRAVANAILT